MVDTNPQLERPTENPEAPPRRRRRHWRTAVLAVGTGLLIGGSFAVVANVHSGPFEGHRFGRHELDPESARERLDFAASWILSRVDATDAQQAEIGAVLDRVVADLEPMLEIHRSQRELVHAALTGDVVDRDLLEEVRQEKIELADRASREVTDAIVEIAEILTPEQRTELASMADRFHSR